MILPLHHCMAIGCLELIDPAELMCRKHWSQVTNKTIADLLCAVEDHEIEQAHARAMLEVAMAEGRVKKFTTPDASQANPPPPMSPGATGPKDNQP